MSSTSRVVLDGGRVVLILGDSRQEMKHIKGVDVIITDPPYGNSDTHASHLSKIKLRNGKAAGRSLNFDGINCEQTNKLAEQWVECAKRWVIFTCEWKHAHALDAAGLLIRLGIWRKPDGSPQFTGDRPGTGWEAVAICHRKGKKRWNGGGSHAFWSFPKGQTKSEHPTEKPLGLLKAFVRDFTEDDELVCDPYMGSGTTGVAVIRFGRRFIGIEKNPEYFQTALDRIEAELRRPKGFNLQSSKKSAVVGGFGFKGRKRKKPKP